MRALAPALILATACGGGLSTTASSSCPDTPLAEGLVSAGYLVCRDQRFSANGEGRGQDLWLANSRVRAIVRHPIASLTLPGLGGGSLVDAAPWGKADVLHEALPLVDGAGLVVHDLTVEDDGLTLYGTLRALPGERHDREGEAATVRWSLAPDDPWIHLEGADGLWVHPRADMDLLDGWLWGEQVVVGHDASSVEDLGGVVILHDLTKLLFATWDEALALRDPTTQVLSLTADDATTADLFADGILLGRAELTDGLLDATVPARVDQVRLRGPEHGSVRLDLPSTTTTLPDAAQLDLRPAWGSQRPRPFSLAWRASDGTTGERLVEPSGDELSLPAGELTLTARLGPEHPPVVHTLDLTEGSRQIVGLDFQQGWDRGDHLAAALAWPMSRDPSVRASEADRSRAALLAGAELLVGQALHEVGDDTLYLNDAPWLRASTGASVRSSEGWSVAARPFTASVRTAGHGVPDIRDQGPEAAARLMQGGTATDRRLTVDLAWLRSLDTPVWLSNPRPEELLLGAPGLPPAFENWTPWFDALDHAVPLLPVGPWTWLHVGDREIVGAVEIERALVRGHSVASTGPLLWLEADGTLPGELAPAGDAPLTVTLTAKSLPGELDGLTLVGRGGAVLHTATPTPPLTTLTLTLDRTSTDWLVLVGHSTDGQHWAATAPLWLEAPAGTTDTAPDTDDGAG